MVGSFLGDFVKGRLAGDYPDDVERGIRLHRAVDAFTDRHPVARRSARRFAPPFRRYGPVMVDVIYDHFLAGRWAAYHPDDLGLFCDSVFEALDERRDILPPRAHTVARRMMATRSMEQYHRDRFVAGSLDYLSQRIKRDNPLSAGFEEFVRLRHELREDFTIFFPELLRFCDDWQQENR